MRERNFSGNVIEIAGEAGSGKTQLGLQVRSLEILPNSYGGS